ncbi:jerky protein homolog-like [Hylaeus anthracinus]|uniref:jerky protein homolog-like n=1 Tax=Hylaeus anthracinus TaxID=313031 RepID=UPI0023B99852|nr:jerky protein homolog-like [Hylaeus anthracinus]
MLSGRTKTCVNLSLEQRLDILRQLEDRVPQNQLAKNYGISVVTIHRIKKNAEKIRRQSQTPGTEGKKRFRRPVLVELDARLFTWYQGRRALEETVTNALLQEKAMKLNEEFGGPSNFSASNGWIWRFKQRHGISFDDPNNDAAIVDTRIAEEFTKRFMHRLAQEGIKLQNLYSMDDSGLAWKYLPPKVLINATIKSVYGKKARNNRVTVGLCANAIGTHKLPPLFIHKCKTPRALKHCWDHLPVVFKAQMNACMEQKVFTDWLENYFKPAVRNHQLQTGNHGKVLLLVAKSRTHELLPEVRTGDNNVEVVYVPTSSNLLPMEREITSNVKVSFRRRMLSRILKFPEGVAEFCTDYDVKDCINFLNEAWTDVAPAVIYNSWKKLLGVDVTEDQVEEQSRVCPGDTSDITTIKDIMKAIVKEPVSHKEVEDWLVACEKVEGDVDLGRNDYPDEMTSLQLDTDEIERTIAKLVLWAETQSIFVKFHARVVKDYYDLIK